MALSQASFHASIASKENEVSLQEKAAKLLSLCLVTAISRTHHARLAYCRQLRRRQLSRWRPASSPRFFKKEVCLKIRIGTMQSEFAVTAKAGNAPGNSCYGLTVWAD